MQHESTVSSEKFKSCVTQVFIAVLANEYAKRTYSATGE